MPPLRIVFFGTAELACASLSALTRVPGVQLVAVVTQPDRPRGRHLNSQASPVKTLAQLHDLALLQPERARSESFLIQLAQLQPDLIVVVAYGQILPAQILALPRFGCLNVHASILPKFRGAAPIQWAILSDERETGVTLMKMDQGLDTGDILDLRTTPISTDDDAETLHERLAAMGAGLLIETLPGYVAGAIHPRQQVHASATYARKISREDGRIDWSQPARAIWNRVRAFVPWPGCCTVSRAEEKRPLLKIWRAEVVEQGDGLPGEILASEKTAIVVACGRQALSILELQREGGRRLGVREFLAGHPLRAGQRWE